MAIQAAAVQLQAPVVAAAPAAALVEVPAVVLPADPTQPSLQIQASLSQASQILVFRPGAFIWGQIAPNHSLFHQNASAVTSSPPLKGQGFLFHRCSLALGVPPK